MSRTNILIDALTPSNTDAELGFRAEETIATRLLVSLELVRTL